jgi:uncharacterized protein (TIGR02996 family)
MSDYQGLMQAIVESPEDDTHRLVLADWLEDNDKPLWADLIRTQCRLMQLIQAEQWPFSQPYHQGDYIPAGMVELTDLREALQNEVIQPFRCLLPMLGDEDDSPVQALSGSFSLWFRRGLIDTMTIHGGQAAQLLARDAEEVMSEIPLRHLRITRAGRGAGYHEQSDPLRSATLRVLLDRPFMSRLVTLDLRNLDLRREGARVLLRHRDKLRLKKLYFDQNNVGEDIAGELRSSFGSVLHLVPRPTDDDDIPF